MQTISQPVLIVLTAVWLVLFATGRWQLARIRKSTFDLALQEGRDAQGRDPRLSVEEAFDAFISKWRPMLKEQAWFIPHRTELWPVPVRADELQRRLNLTPAWLGAFLALRGIRLPADPELNQQIESVLSSAPAYLKNRRPK